MDLELEVIPVDQRQYAVRVVHAPVGGLAVGTFSLDVDAVLDRLPALEQAVLASAVAARRATPLAEQPLQNVGSELFRALFSGEVYGTYRASLGAAAHGGEHLRVVLRLGAPQLAALPWEMLFDPETDSYLCRTEPLLRSIPAPDYHPKPLEVVLPLRVLGVIASPQGLPQLDVSLEKNHVIRALAGQVAAGRVELTWAPEPTWEGVHEQLLNGPWHALHFIGHGDYDANNNEGQLILVGPDGRPNRVSATRLVDLLSTARPVPRLVLLNSCYSGRAGEQDLFAGTSAALVRGGISAVTAMQFTVSDQGAIAFARGFYSALSFGRGVDEAVRNGRISMRGESEGTLEWVTPVIYVRGGSTHLFAPLATVRSVSESNTRTQSPLSGEQQTQLSMLYAKANAEMRKKNDGAAIGLFRDVLALDPKYRDASALLDIARHRQETAIAYGAARDAENNSEWPAAIRGYALVLGDPGYPEAAERLEICELRQKTTELLDELHLHAESGNWQAVLDIGQELAVLDPEAADLRGRGTHADIELLYARARRAQSAGHVQTARNLYARILRTEPRFRDAVIRREQCDQDMKALAFSPDGTRLETGCTGQRVRIADIGIQKIELQHAKFIFAVAFSPDGTRLATGGRDKCARIWDAATGREELKVTLSGWANWVRSVAFSPDGRRLATGSSDEAARIWDAGRGLPQLEVHHDGGVTAVAFSPDGKRLATASADQTARIWDADTGTQQLQVHHDGGVTAVAFSPDGTCLVTGSDDQTARIWDADTGTQQLQVRHDGGVTAVAFSPNGSVWGSASADKTARIWDSGTGRQRLKIRQNNWIRSLAFSPDGSLIATGSDDKTARIWDIAGE